MESTESTVSTAAKLGEHFTISATGVVHVMDPAVPKLSGLQARRCKDEAMGDQWVELKGSESDTREPDSALDVAATRGVIGYRSPAWIRNQVSQVDVGNPSLSGLQKLEEEAPVQQVVVDESRLIDLPPAEQKRRGNELLSLLSDPWRRNGYLSDDSALDASAAEAVLWFSSKEPQAWKWNKEETTTCWRRAMGKVFGRWKQHSRFTTYCHARKLLVRP
eukprot:Skav214913  [mRNA]  locus=scaffold3783:213337:230646:- [translate_table: standard]